jgi:glycosyltransferase involved in cell wall biosynthesis
MRILFCSPTQLSKEFGASKVTIELAEEMAHLGWQCEFLAPADLLGRQSRNETMPYQAYLREHLLKVANEFDVIEYDHHHLPYPRSEFPTETLFIARSVLLAHHFNKPVIPLDKRLKSRVHRLLYGREEARKWQKERQLAHLTVQEADLINVANYDDQAELLRCDIAKEKIVVIPYGISRKRRKLFDAVPSELPSRPQVAFIGTFDTRKGATDFPSIIEQVCAALPDAEFRLIGTHTNEATVLSAFPQGLRKRIAVVPQYDSDELPEILTPCSVGIFPSYIEGFGFGVLEMLAASIPVIAYNAPGPPMMLPPEYLVPRGDTKAMSDKVIELLQNRERLLAARRWAKQQSQQFCWQRIAKQTSEIYAEHRQRKQIEICLV